MVTAGQSSTDPDAALRNWLRDWPRTHLRQGFRRAYRDARGEDRTVNHKIQPLWRDEGLRVPQRRCRRIECGRWTFSSTLPINLRDVDGNPLVENRTVTGFATVEEGLAGVKSRVQFLLEDELRAKGANYVRSTIPDDAARRA